MALSASDALYTGSGHSSPEVSSVALGVTREALSVVIRWFSVVRRGLVSCGISVGSEHFGEVGRVLRASIGGHPDDDTLGKVAVLADRVDDGTG